MQENNQNDFKIEVKTLGRFLKLLDALMVPIMYLISGTLKEAPQEGHRWNVRMLSEQEILKLDQEKMIHCDVIGKSLNHRWFFLFHLPIFGGWRDYVVLRPAGQESKWFVGFIAGDGTRAISRHELSGSVRMLVGSTKVSFFGIDGVTFKQIAVKKIGEGRIGEGGSFAKERLL